MAVEQVYAVLIALEGDTLLLPNLTIAEVLGTSAVKSNDSALPWLAGYLDWNHRRVPVVRFEVLNGGIAPPPTRRERVVVLHTPGVYLPNATVALITQGYPHLVTLSREALKPQELRGSDRVKLALARARISSREALIPDLLAVEAEVARATEIGMPATSVA